jgi:hypothetical protein
MVEVESRWVSAVAAVGATPLQLDLLDTGSSDAGAFCYGRAVLVHEAPLAVIKPSISRPAVPEELFERQNGMTRSAFFQLSSCTE